MGRVQAGESEEMGRRGPRGFAGLGGGSGETCHFLRLGNWEPAIRIDLVQIASHTPNSMHRLRFYASNLSRQWPRIITAPGERRIFEKNVLEVVDGIRIIDFSERAKVDKRFLVDTVAALHLLKSVDCRRFHRIQREIKYIINWERLGFGSYCRPIRTCYIDYGRFRDHSDREWNLWYYCATLVHQATQGAIYSRYVDYAPALRCRIERVCRTEARRFVTKCDGPDRQWSQALVGPFDEKVWRGNWTFVKAWTQIISRIRESRNSLKDDG